MLNVTQSQLLDVWMELEDALRGTNGYGGATAEIYAYRLQTRRPMAEMGAGENGPGRMTREAQEEQAAQAAENLFEILTLFTRMRHARAIVNGRRLGPWLRRVVFDHRAHVTIESKPEKRARKGVNR